MKVLVLGKGGKEHALCHTFQRQGHQTVYFPDVKSSYFQIQSLHNFSSICQFVKENQIDLTVVDSVEILAKGIKDYFDTQNLPLFGSNKKASIIGINKAWVKMFMQQENIPTAHFAICKTLNEAKKALDDLFVKGKGVVIKPSKIIPRKWVMICDTYNQALFALESMKEKYFKEASDPIIIEERLFGLEVSIMACCDGKKASFLLSAKDYKRLFKGDNGPSTDGIGAYAPVDFLTKRDLQFIQKNIFDRAMEGFIKRDISFQGTLYAGLILTKQGIQVLELNCRFGDPETQAILPLLKTDLAKVMMECCGNNLRSNIEFEPKYSCCIVATTKGYPKMSQSGHKITGIKYVEEDPHSFVFQAGMSKVDNNRLITTGGRILSVVSIDNTVLLARKRAYEQIKKIYFKGAYYREDIAEKVLMEEKK